MSTQLQNKRPVVLALAHPSSPPHTSRLSLRERARVAAEVERARTKQQAREQRTAELLHQREDLVRVLQHVLEETVAPEAIDLPEDVMQAPCQVLTAEVDGLAFCVSAHPADDCTQGTSRLKVLLTCPRCQDANWFTVVSLSGLGRLLRQLEDGSLSDSCSTCLMAAEWENDPFRDE